MIETTTYGDSTVYLRFVPASEYLALNIPVATSVHCFPVKGEEILFTINPRGIDIIGGHVEAGEDNETALIRESQEEASIIPVEYVLIGAIEVDNRDNPKALAAGYPLKGYQLFYAVTDFILEDFKATHECTDRQFIHVSDVATLHHKWLKTHEAIIDEMNHILNLTPVKKNKI